MTKDGKPSGRNNGGGRGNAGKTHGRGNDKSKSKGSTQNKPTTRAILRIKQSLNSNEPIKVNFKDPTDEEETVKELIRPYFDEQPEEWLIELEKKCMELAEDYELFVDGKWKRMLTSMRRSLAGTVKDQWKGVVDSIREGTHANGNTAAQRAKMLKCFQELNELYLADDALKNQKKAMRDGELTYQDHDHKKMARRMFQINDDLVYFKTNATKFTMEEMAEEVIPNSLKPTARLEYIKQGGKKLTTEKAILDLCDEIGDYLNEANKIERDRKNRNDHDKSNRSNERSNKPNPCKKHSGQHDWKDCPDNKFSKSYKGEKDGEVKSTEADKKVRFNDAPEIRSFDALPGYDDESVTEDS
jgi:hypothetical protein